MTVKFWTWLSSFSVAIFMESMRIYDSVWIAFDMVQVLSLANVADHKNVIPEIDPTVISFQDKINALRHLIAVNSWYPGYPWLNGPISAHYTGLPI